MAKYTAWLEPDNLLRLEAWARDGLTLEQIAHNIGCNVKTLWEWTNKYPPICNALKKGKEVVDIEVENALLKRALGYSYEETMIEDSPDGRKKRVTKKFIPPDVAAIVFFLKNRRPDKWRDKPVDESESATLSAARELLGGIPSVINGQVTKH